MARGEASGDEKYEVILEITEGRFTSERLRQLGWCLHDEFKLLSIAVFCLFEWDEPADDEYGSQTF